MFSHVVRAGYLSGYKLRLAFDDSAEGVVDLEYELDRPVFRPLQDLVQFRRFAVHPVARTLVWSNGADFAPDFLKRKPT